MFHFFFICLVVSGNFHFSVIHGTDINALVEQSALCVKFLDITHLYRSRHHTAVVVDMIRCQHKAFFTVFTFCWIKYQKRILKCFSTRIGIECIIRNNGIDIFTGFIAHAADIIRIKAFHGLLRNTGIANHFIDKTSAFILFHGFKPLADSA